MTEKLDQIFFYNLEKAIKTYRQYAQKKINQQGFDITIDQWLVLKAIAENPHAKQREMAEKVFKDNASVTRIMELLMQKELITREQDAHNRRKNKIQITKRGEKLLKEIQPIIKKNRTKALKNCTSEELAITHQILKEIIQNCQST